MTNFVMQLVSRLKESDIKVVTKSVCWKPIKINYRQDDPTVSPANLSADILQQLNTKPLEDLLVVGHAVNQYFFQSEIARTNSAVIWSSFDIVKNEFCCIKAYYVESFRRERALRCYGETLDVISQLDKVVDEILHHASVASHPGISTIREIVVNIEDGVFYVVMDYYPGQILHFDVDIKTYTISPLDLTLSAKIEGKACDVQLYKEDDAKVIMKDIAQTVSYLHSKGIIHKDLKPENILLTGSKSFAPETVEVKLSDDIYIPHFGSYPLDRRFTDNIRNEDLMEHIKEFLVTNNSFNYDEVTLPTPVGRHFPYSDTTETEFNFYISSKCPFVCDIIRQGDDDSNNMRIGLSAVNFAKKLLTECENSSDPILNYFLLDNNPDMPYKKHEAFAAAADYLTRYCSNKPIPKRHCSGSSPNQRTPVAVISDFGVASLGEIKDGKKEPLIYDGEGTTSFCSPEALKHVDGGISGNKRDIFSLGLVLYTMIYGRLPHEGGGGIELLVNISEKPLQFPSYRCVSPDLKDLLKGMLCIEPEHRLNMEQVLAHRWFDGI
ncbi:kinase domain containing protein protein [Babesia ovis]|uniref:Kinase domain containing protein protein n=1 Tax=Babesia ovis TaxID=5869 RepID=A0A9W5WW70_BABOV|nr:kinase domain containing protein protein [Babesia ovis]